MTIQALAGIERRDAPSRHDFEREYRRASTPVVLTGLLDSWPARTRWSPEYLKATCGARRVPAAVTRGGMLEHDDASGVRYETVSLGSLADSIAGAATSERYLTCSVDEELPELVGDLRDFVYTRDSRWIRRRIWFGPGGSASPMHQDLPENLYAQFVGRKRMILFPPEQSSRLYPYGWHSALPNFAAVDAESPDFDRHPRFRGACGVSVVLEPGDVLYLPSRWWHQTRSLDASISLNVWWTCERRLAAVIKLAEGYKRARSLSI